MQFFLDHLIAVIIGSVVLLIAVIIQFRGTQDAAESTVTYVVYQDVMNMATYIQRDLENMLTEAQATDALSDGRYAAGGALLCTGLDTTTAGIHAATHTRLFAFPTLKDPDNPLLGEVVEVRYDLVNTGRTVTLPTQDSTKTVPLFRLNRMEDGALSGSSEAIITSFRIETMQKGSAGYAPLTGLCTTNLSKVRFEFKAALTGLEVESGDQRSVSQTNISRYGTTVHLSNWD